MNISFDFSEVNALSVDLSRAPRGIERYAKQAIKVTARRTKDAARRNVGGPRLMPHVQHAIDYDKLGDGLEIEVGFDKGSAQGPLGNFLEYGSRYFGARQPLARALHENEADFVKGMERAALDALEGLA